MTTLILISLIILVGYVAYTIVSYDGIPTSISATYYRLKHKWLFQIAMIASGFVLMPAIIGLTPEHVKFLAFLGCAGLIFVGASPRFTDKFEGKVHSVGATILLLASQSLVATLMPWMLLVWLPLVIQMARKYNRKVSFRSYAVSIKLLFWIELIAILTTYATYIILA